MCSSIAEERTAKALMMI